MNPILDAAQIEMLRMIPGSQTGTLFDEVAVAFLAEAETQLKEAREAFRNQDWARFARSVHKMKGSGGNFGGTALQQVAEVIERAFRTGQAPEAAVVELFFKELEGLRDAVKEECGQGSVDARPE
jgi:HPt (histidine-containing phosphotransfer) domain-containing protein